jgi:diguanylate cyclase (GGDEF)-like protein
MLTISNSIENIRKLVHLKSMVKELDKLYVIDPLCNIYNRNGFIRNADPMFKRTKASKQKLLISFIDMDGLKHINDCYGHNEGDFALQRLAGVISDCCNGGRICARFGGDEFIILGENACEEDIMALETVFEAQLKNINTIVKKPYTIAASIGTIVSEIQDNVTLFNLITQADEIMYANKKRKRTSRYLRHEESEEEIQYESSGNDQA